MCYTLYKVMLFSFGKLTGF